MASDKKSDHVFILDLRGKNKEEFAEELEKAIKAIKKITGKKKKRGEQDPE